MIGPKGRPKFGRIAVKRGRRQRLHDGGSTPAPRRTKSADSFKTGSSASIVRFLKSQEGHHVARHSKRARDMGCSSPGMEDSEGPQTRHPACCLPSARRQGALNSTPSPRNLSRPTQAMQAGMSREPSGRGPKREARSLVMASEVTFRGRALRLRRDDGGCSPAEIAIGQALLDHSN
jgi:hypothetical protein